MRHLLVYACILTLGLSATAQDTISTEDPFALDPATSDTHGSAPAEPETNTTAVPTPTASVREEVSSTANGGDAAQVENPIEYVPSLAPIRGESLLDVTEPQSVPGIIHSVSDAQGNAYAIVVIRPMTFEPRPVCFFRLEEREVTETVETAAGESKTLAFPLLEEVSVNGVQATVTPQAPVFVPLLPSMKCFGIKDGILEASSPAELKEGTDVIVTYSTAEAMDVADGLYESYNTQIVMTGVKPQLPGYILVLNLRVSAGQPKSLGEFLKTAPSFRGAVTFFGDVEREAETETKEEPIAYDFQLPRDSDIAWHYARRDFFAGRYDTSEPVLNSLIQSEAQDPMVYYLRGLLRYSRGDESGAEVDFTEGAKLESRRGYSNDICRALERLQGPARVVLERHRRSYARY